MIKYNILSLSIALARAEFKLKNEGTYLGVLWYLLNPLLYFFLLLAIFSQNLGTAIPHYPLYLLLGLILFHYFRNITIEATKILYDHRAIIKSIQFPQEALIGSVILKILFSHILEFLLFAAVAAYFHNATITLLLYPLFLIWFTAFIYGISLVLASTTIFFMDLEHIWSFASQLLWFITPLFFALHNQPTLSAVNSVNPLYYFLTIARDIIIYERLPEAGIVWMAIGFTALSLIIGKYLFRKLSAKIPEAI